MDLYFYNSLSRKKELFVPIKKDEVKMYVCGPTVYDRPHIGNARSVVVYDVLYRLLCHLYGVRNIQYVRNITDVDDKINMRAKELGISIQELTRQTVNQFHEDMDYLYCLSPNFEPKATENIDQIIEIISILMQNGFAYESNAHVYFDITKDKNYAQISGKKLNDLFAGVRIDVSENKTHPGDFVLWKPAAVNDDISSIFASPWGLGRPGWHIECSAMSRRYLGTDFDIHGGGIDLIFPHHTNEIAQSCSAFTGSKYARYWIHNGFLTVNNEKMSKSLGNFYTVHDLRQNDIKGEVLRLMLLSAHYRKPLDYNDKAIYDAQELLQYLYGAIQDIIPLTQSVNQEFIKYLCDDLNISSALVCLRQLAHSINKCDNIEIKQQIAGELIASAQILGLMNHTADNWFERKRDETIEEQIQMRKNAKLSRNWQQADHIRDELLAKGIILEDKPGGETIWRKK